MTKHTKPKKVESYETPVCRGKISLLQKKVTCQKQHRNQLVVRRMVLISTLYRRNLWGKSWWIFFLISSNIFQFCVTNPNNFFFCHLISLYIWLCLLLTFFCLFNLNLCSVIIVFFRDGADAYVYVYMLCMMGWTELMNHECASI
ncbi:hypothetical protein AAZX31_20G154000 [Glycine max]